MANSKAIVVHEHRPSDTRSEIIQAMSQNHNHSRAARETVVTVYIHDQAKPQNKRVIKKTDGDMDDSSIRGTVPYDGFRRRQSF